ARAIGQSSFAMPTQTLGEAEQQGVKLGEKVGAPTLAALRSKSAEELLRASDRQFRPIVDGYVAPENPYAVYAAGRQIKVPVLVGSVANERGNYPQPKNMQEYLAFTARQYPRAAEEVGAAFPVKSDEEATQVFLIRERDHMAANMRRWAEVMSKSGMPAYLFY